MYKPLALTNGAIIAIMILSNALMVEVLGNTASVLLNHIIGLSIALLVLLITKTNWHSIKGIPIFYLLAGITGLLTVYLSNIAFIALGATITLMLSMFGRLVTSSIIDHFGLMGMTRYPFKPMKLIGLGLMSIGVLLIVLN